VAEPRSILLEEFSKVRRLAFEGVGIVDCTGFSLNTLNILTPCASRSVPDMVDRCSRRKYCTEYDTTKKQLSTGQGRICPWDLR